MKAGCLALPNVTRLSRGPPGSRQRLDPLLGWTLGDSPAQPGPHPNPTSPCPRSPGPAEMVKGRLEGTVATRRGLEFTQPGPSSGNPKAVPHTCTHVSKHTHPCVPTTWYTCTSTWVPYTCAHAVHTLRLHPHTPRGILGCVDTCAHMNPVTDTEDPILGRGIVAVVQR